MNKYPWPEEATNDIIENQAKEIARLQELNDYLVQLAEQRAGQMKEMRSLINRIIKLSGFEYWEIDLVNSWFDPKSGQVK